MPSKSLQYAGNTPPQHQLAYVHSSIYASIGMCCVYFPSLGACRCVHVHVGGLSRDIVVATDDQRRRASIWRR